MDIPSEDDIHDLYGDIQKRNEAERFRKRVSSENPNPFTGRQPFVNNPARNNQPSFRSIYFNVGEGLRTLDPGETRVMARITIPAQYSGILTGFSQFFGGCDDADTDTDIAMNVVWGLRINGLVQPGLQDFVGEYSTLMLPHSVYFPLLGGITLGSSDVSDGSHIVGERDIPTAALLATNNNTTSVVLQGRLIGYTFPVTERNDEFQNF